MCTIHSSSPYNHCYFWNSYIDIKMTLKTRYTFVYNGLICCHIQSDRVVFHFDLFFVIERSKISILILSLLLVISIIIIYYLIFVYKNSRTKSSFKIMIRVLYISSFNCLLFLKNLFSAFLLKQKLTIYPASVFLFSV